MRLSLCLRRPPRSLYGDSIPGRVLADRLASYVHLFNLYWYSRRACAAGRPRSAWAVMPGWPADLSHMAHAAMAAALGELSGMLQTSCCSTLSRVPVAAFAVLFCSSPCGRALALMGTVMTRCSQGCTKLACCAVAAGRMAQPRCWRCMRMTAPSSTSSSPPAPDTCVSPSAPAFHNLRSHDWVCSSNPKLYCATPGSGRPVWRRHALSLHSN